MPSSPKIHREVILKTALDMLIENGYGSINITALAKRLGCSTQPISWQFGGMDGFRKELIETAYQFASEKSTPRGRNAMEAFEKVGESYVDMAFDMPNLVMFIGSQCNTTSYEGKLLSVLNQERNQAMLDELAELTGVSKEDMQTFMQTVVIYTHGFAMLIATGAIKETKENAHKMLKEMGIRNMIAMGIDPETAGSYY